MDFFIAALTEHGYSILFAAVFLETIGFPVPAAIALLIAGGASANGTLQGSLVLGAALSAMLAGDTLMFLLGRYTGWWLLSVLCRLSLNPESCIMRAADAFYKRGRTLLLFAKFVPGINTMAPPLAGSMNMRWTQFIGLDAAGAALYIGAYWTLGYLFADAIGAITKTMQAFGRAAEWAVIAALVAYAGYLVWNWIKAGSSRSIPRVRPSDAAQKVSAGGGLIYDVRSHGYYDQKAKRIQGSRRWEPNALNQQTLDPPPDGQLVFLYCTCVGDATSARAAEDLLRQGIKVDMVHVGLS